MKQLLTDELKTQGIPIEVSRKGTNGRIGFGTKSIKTPGVEIERRVYRKYSTTIRNSDKIEELIINTNGYISIEKMQKIADKYKAAYRPSLYNPDIKEIKIYVE